MSSRRKRGPNSPSTLVAAWVPAFAGDDIEGDSANWRMTPRRAHSLPPLQHPADRSRWKCPPFSVAPDTVVIEAPLAPNINHRKTVFGGSASALGILAAWSLVHLRLAGTGSSTGSSSSATR